MKAVHNILFVNVAQKQNFYSSKGERIGLWRIRCGAGIAGFCKTIR